MKKRMLLILSFIVMTVFVGCTKTEIEDMISKEINGKYVYNKFLEDVWNNDEYGYRVTQTVICKIDGQNIIAYLLSDKVKEQLTLTGTELGSDGYSINYKFKSKSGETYTFNALRHGDNKENFQMSWEKDGTNEAYVFHDLLTKEECEMNILQNLGEVELENLSSTNFPQEANLDLNTIKNEIEEVKNTVYKKTGHDKDTIYYIYTPDGGGVNIGSDKEKYYVFTGIHIDEEGKIIAQMDYLLFVDKKDLTLYTYRQDENGQGRVEFYDNTTDQVEENISQSNTNSSEDTDVKPGKYSREEIQAMYDKQVADGDLVHALVWNKTKVIEGELCYWLNWGWENASGPVDRVGYIGSNTLNIYQDPIYWD